MFVAKTFGNGSFEKWICVNTAVSSAWKLLNTYSNVKDTGMKAICILANANLEQAFNYIRIIAQFNPLLVKAFDARTLHM